MSNRKQIILSKENIDKFKSLIDKNPSDPEMKRLGCWGFKGRHCDEGYAYFHCNSTSYRAHRVSYTIFNGVIPNTPKGETVRHGCNNKGCIKGKHLTIGTHKQNMEDNVKNQKIVKNVEIVPGGDNKRALKILKKYIKGDKNAKQIAREEGISDSSIHSWVDKYENVTGINLKSVRGSNKHLIKKRNPGTKRKQKLQDINYPGRSEYGDSNPETDEEFLALFRWKKSRVA